MKILKKKIAIVAVLAIVVVAIYAKQQYEKHLYLKEKSKTERIFLEELGIELPKDARFFMIGEPDPEEARDGFCKLDIVLLPSPTSIVFHAKSDPLDSPIDIRKLMDWPDKCLAQERWARKMGFYRYIGHIHRVESHYYETNSWQVIASVGSGSRGSYLYGHILKLK